MFWDCLSVPPSRVKLDLKMGPTGSPETSVSNHLTLHNNPEDRRIYLSLSHTVIRQDPQAPNTVTLTKWTRWVSVL